MIHDLVVVLEALGAVPIIGGVVAAVWRLLTVRDLAGAHLLVAQGALLGLSLKLTATVLVTITLGTWPAIAHTIVLIALRTLLKGVLTQTTHLYGLPQPTGR